jgi:hypothetical protein
MLIIDEAVESSSGDKTTIIEHKPVKSYEEEKALYVRPLPREKNLPNLREIAGNVAFEYISGKRHYAITDEEEKAPFMSRHFNKMTLVIPFVLGVLILVGLYFIKG